MTIVHDPEGFPLTDDEKANAIETLTRRMDHNGHVAVTVPAVIDVEPHASLGYLATAAYGSSADFCSVCDEPIVFPQMK